jgi:hypothetical protein
MAVTLDSKFQDTTNVSTSNFSFVSNAGVVAGTVGSNSNRVLVCLLLAKSTVANKGTVTLKWNNVVIPNVGSLDIGGAYCIFVGVLAAPDTGNLTLLASWTGSDTSPVVLGAVSLYNAQQSPAYSDYVTNTGTSTAATVTITNVLENDYSVAAELDNNATSGTISAGTEAWNERRFYGNYLAGYRAGNGTTSWTLGSSVIWGMAGVRLIDDVVKTKLLVRV